ncbi:PH domain-containing protein [Novispirillum itersonii]|uniref:Membrane protein YdbS with pleckstrin-like domain n=1 Tax=Novispirillum itersonii TaxID=189 RepID=A0A7X0DME6_NOVIT|nr:PH domain-containing protein [Novispirillum itersonii]MBB6210214.1 membrane protein YdbS with pleckstrin-like domain [Novispirillum itersonii]
MASYVRESLLDGEKILYEGAVSLWAILPKLLAGLLLLPLFGYGLVLWMSASVYYSSTELCVTNRRVVARLGLVRRRTVEFHIAKVESVRIEQGLWGRLFNFGTITVTGASEAGEAVKGIENPVAFRRALLQVQEIVLRRSGAAVAPARARLEELPLPPGPPLQKDPAPKRPPAPPQPPVRQVERVQQALGRAEDESWLEEAPARRRPAAFSPAAAAPRRGPEPGEWD